MFAECTEKKCREVLILTHPCEKGSDLLQSGLNSDQPGAVATVQLWQEQEAASLVSFVENMACEGANNIQQQKKVIYGLTNIPILTLTLWYSIFVMQQWHFHPHLYDVGSKRLSNRGSC